MLKTLLLKLIDKYNIIRLPSIRIRKYYVLQVIRVDRSGNNRSKRGL